jgi:O-antigen/teichoic acid export membrane protein
MFAGNALWSIAGGAVPAITALVSIPILIASLGYEIFAITSLLISLTIFFYVYDFGIGRAMVFFTPKVEYLALEAAGRLNGTAFLASLFLGIVVTALAWSFAPWLVQNWLNIQPHLVEQTICAFQIAAISITPSLLANTCKGMLEGRSHFKEANLCKMFSGASIFIAPFGSHNLIFISAGILASRLLALMLYVVLLGRVVEYKAIRFNIDIFQVVCKYGLWAALSGFISTMFVYGDRFIVARYLSPEHLSLYVASQDILIRYLLIPWSMAMVLMPVFAAGTLSKVGEVDLFRKQARQAGFLSLSVMALVIITTLAVRPFFNEFNIPEITTKIVMIQMLGVFFCAIAQLPLIYLYARGKPGLITFIYSVEAVIYVLIAPIIFKQYGIIGACIVWSARLVLEYCLLWLLAEREMKRHA